MVPNGIASDWRRQPSTVALVVVVVLAGCSSPLSFSGEGTPSESDQPLESGLRSGQLPTGIDSVSLSSGQRSELTTLSANFYEKLPAGEDERRKQTLTAAEELCQRHRQLGGAVNVTRIAEEETPELVHNRSRRAEIAIDVIHARFNERLDRERIVHRLETTERYAIAAVPLFLSYNRMADDACVAAETRSDAAIEAFYFSAFYFGLEAFLIASGAGYEPSYRTTKFVANQSTTIYRASVVCEYCDVLAPSEIHTQIADRPQSLATYVRERFGDSRISFGGTTTQWRYILQQQGVSYARAVLRDCPGELADSVSEENADDAVEWVREQGEEAANGTIPDVSDSTVVDAAVSCVTERN